MKDFLNKQIENNYSIIIYILTLTKKRYDLFFKMVGGQNGPSYRNLRDIKNTYITVCDNKSFGGLQSVTNPDGSLCKNHYLVAIALITGYNLEFIQKKITSASLWITNLDWLRATFTEEEVKTIIEEKNTWIQKIK